MMDTAHKLTDKRLAVIERAIRKIFGRCAKEVSKKAGDYFAAFARKDAEKKKLVEAGQMTKEGYQKWRQSQMMVGAQYRRMSDSLTAQMKQSYEAALAYANGRLPEIYAINFNAITQAIEMEIPAALGYSFDIVNADTVANLASKKASLLPYKEVDGRKFERWSRQKTNSTILSGIMKGDSIPDIAKSLVKVVGMTKNTAVTNARTMVTSAENAGRIDSMKRAEAMGTIVEKEWIATHDARTRDWHRDLDGQTKPIDKPFVNDFGEIRFPGDPTADPANVYNCRCTIAEVVVGFGPVPKNVRLEDLYK